MENQVKEFYLKLIPKEKRDQFKGVAEKHFPELLKKIETLKNKYKESNNSWDELAYIRASKDLIIKVSLKLRF